MGLIILRYGEIALKGQNRTFFLRKLRRNVRLSLKASQITGEVWQEGQRVYLETEQIAAAVEAVQRVFGIVSLSPVEVVPTDASAGPNKALKAISREAVALAQRAGLQRAVAPRRPFRVRARRSDKSFHLVSPEIERHVGAAVVEATQAPVDLSADNALEIGVEVQPGRALVFGETIPGPGGLPLSSQGKVVALISSGIDSPVATWLLMKRGCGVIPVHFSTSEAQTDQVEAIIAALNRWAYGWQLKPIILSHDETLTPTLATLRELRAERWACLFCKRAMVAKAAEIAEEMGASAVITGDSLGQVASQTLSNLEVISYGIRKPLLRPLIGLDKTEIMDLARRIGTYELSTGEAHACPFLPDRPLTQASVEKLRVLLEKMEEIGRRSLGPSAPSFRREEGQTAANHA